MLDAKDQALLDLLRKDGRTPWAKLGEPVGLSADAVRVRVERMISDGTARLATLLDPTTLGYTTRASLFVTVRGSVAGFVDWARTQGTIIHLVRVLGQYTFLVEIVAGSREAAHQFLVAISAAPGVKHVEANSILDILRWREDTRLGLNGGIGDPIDLDDDDLEAIRILVDEPRVGLRELAERLDRSYSTLRRRVLALYASGAIRATVIVDDAAIEGRLSAAIMVTRSGDITAAAEALLTHDEVTILTATSGQYALVGEIVVPNEASLQRVLTEVGARVRAPIQVLPYAHVDKLPASLSFKNAPLSDGSDVMS